MTSRRRLEPGTPGANLLPAYGPPAHALADVLCAREHCQRAADGWLEGVPTCVDCVGMIVERDAALDAWPWLTLPDLDDTAFHS